MKIAFVGIRRKFSEIPEDYRDHFIRYHLEMPFYFAREGANEIFITTVDHEGNHTKFQSGGSVRCVLEDRLEDYGPFDLVIHWRKWAGDLYQDDALNVLHTCDHSYSREWRDTVIDEFRNGKLHGIICYRTWHQQNLFEELEQKIPIEYLWVDLTLGVDTDTYKPDWQVKDPYQLLWSSDPGRGFSAALELVLKLHARDRRFRMHVCYPDYVDERQLFVSGMKRSHPALIWHGQLKNGPELWNLFNTSGVLPYTSCFKEPSARVHRQAMSAGSLVLYPDNMGSPSFLIPDDAGIVAPVDTWVESIYREVSSCGWMTYGHAAREYAISENWAIQAQRFNKFFEQKVNIR